MLHMDFIEYFKQINHLYLDEERFVVVLSWYKPVAQVQFSASTWQYYPW